MWAILGFIIGIALGSFVDCIANRSLTTISFFGRSFCDHCKKKLSWYELIPLFSYLFLRGKCSHCHKKISLESFLIEILVGLLTAILFYLTLPSDLLTQPIYQQILQFSEIVLKLIVLIVLSTIFITDIKSGLIPDRITYPSVAIYLVMLILLSALKIGFFYYTLLNDPFGKFLLPPHSDYFYNRLFDMGSFLGTSVLTGVGIGLFFLILILVTRGRGMGGGDMKLGVFLGLAFGFPAALTVLILSFFTGSIFGIALLLIGRKKFGQTIPFGPFLSLAGILTLFWGEKILNWYLNLKIN